MGTESLPVELSALFTKCSVSRNSLKIARILEYYSFFPLQRAIREARHKRVLQEDKSGWHVIVKMPNGERISRYINKKSCYQVHMYLWEYSNC